MTVDPYLILAVLLSYLIGCVPTGFWLGLAIKNIDIREHGSRNIGATNTLRVLGKPLGAIALAGDMLKGVAAVQGFARLTGWEHAAIVCGVAAIVGHIFSVFVRFKGGKGVATSTGVFLGLAPLPTLITAAVFFAVVVVTRMVSAGSILGALTLTALIWLLGYSLPLQIFTSAVALLVIVRHRTNIQRILEGNENRIGGKRT
ncbi:MAG: glycerol-3-phosphate 1-O-acyltransferase PlsY [Candidatus Hydrogenedentota bacterium]